jgi:hypothetical protein
MKRLGRVIRALDQHRFSELSCVQFPMSDTVITIEHLSKSYLVGARPLSGLAGRDHAFMYGAQS